MSQLVSQRAVIVAWSHVDKWYDSSKSFPLRHFWARNKGLAREKALVKDTSVFFLAPLYWTLMITFCFTLISGWKVKWKKYGWRTGEGLYTLITKAVAVPCKENWAKKKGSCLFRVYRGWNTTQLCGDWGLYMINHSKDSYETTSNYTGKWEGFFRGLGAVFVLVQAASTYK